MQKRRDVDLHKKAFELFMQGLSIPEIASSLGLSPNTLKYWKSRNCKCTCGFHDWISFKQKLKVHVPQAVVEATTTAVISRISTREIARHLESICAEELNKPDGLRPRTWRELLETLKVALELRRVLGTFDEFDETDSDGATVTVSQKETTVERTLELHAAVDAFVRKISTQSSRSADENVIKKLVEEG